MSIEAKPIAVMIDGRQYHLRKLSQLDEQALSNWVGGRIINAARASVPSDASEAERREIINQALFAAAPVSWDDDIGRSIINKPDGWAQVIWHCAKKESPLVTAGDILAGIKRDPAGFAEAVKAFVSLQDGTAPAQEPSLPPADVAPPAAA